MGCCEPVLGPVENYYTKYQIDKMIASAVTSGCCITPEEVDEKIEEAISGITVSGVTEEELNNAIASAKTEIEAEIPTVPTSNTAFTNDAGYLTEHQSLSGYATEQWVLDKHYISGVDLSDYALKSEIPTVPTSNTAFTNDAGYLTEHQSLDDYYTKNQTDSAISAATSGYVTSIEMSAFTYDKATIDEKVAEGGTFDPTQYYNKTQTNALVESAITRVEGEIPSLSGYATEQWVEDKHYITGVDLSDYALKSEIPIVPTSNTAFTNDAGYLTEHQSLSAYSTTDEVNELINQSVSGKQDTLSAGTNITIVDNVISATGGGGGITSGEVQTMIDENISGKASVNDAIKNLTFKAYSAEDAVHGMLNVTLEKCNGSKGTIQEIISAGSGITITRNVYSGANISFDDRVVSGKADSSTVSALTNTVTAHTASTSVHVTSTEKNTWNSKVDSSTLNNYLLKSKIWCGTQNEYDSIQNKDSETLYLIHE